ncbi:MAG: putative nuclease YhcG [Ignavibacteriaceae bacterium]|nr:putative nuclease YhcG [Ignavibacteriaceae bacterium]
MKTIKIKSDSLFKSVIKLIEESRSRTALEINSEITLLYWNIGKYIREDILKNNRADYGQRIVESLSERLTNQYGRGWSKRHLHNCLRFTEAFPHEQIVHALRTQLSWTHIRSLIPIEDELKRNFYIELSKIEKWSTRQLDERIQSMLYERTAISKRSDKTIRQELQHLKEQQQITPDIVFRDPYILDFLGLSDTFSETDLETAIIVELQRFIIELGNDFAFLARQKRITIDNRNYKIDLLFYHRRLKCLIAIDLKIGEFEAGYKGQMELYLRYLEKNESLEGENSPVGLILCTGKNEEHVELLRLEKSNIKVAEYITILPDKKLLKQKLHKAIEIARHRLIAGKKV